MKRGRLRTSKDYKSGKWKIQGKKNGVWTDAQDDDRVKQGLPKDLIFDLEYDACAYLIGFISWVTEDSKIQKSLPAGDMNGPNVRLIDKVKAEKKRKQKLAKKSKRRNRK